MILDCEVTALAGLIEYVLERPDKAGGKNQHPYGLAS